MSVLESKSALYLAASLLLAPVASHAQLAPPNERGVTMGHWHAIVPDVQAAEKFWMLFDAQPIMIDNTVVMKLAGVFIFLTQGNPVGPTAGTSLNHIGLRVSHGKQLTDTLRKSGVRGDPVDPVTGRPGFWKPGLRTWGDFTTADGLKIEILDNVVEGQAGLTAKIAGVADPSQKKDLPPVASDHNHMYLPTKASVNEAEQWYSKMFGAQPFADTGAGALLPGARLRMDAAEFRADSPQKPVPTKGHVIDHIGFEINQLEGFCQALTAAGVKFDQPYSRTRHQGFASAEITDPWGTSIELIEGLNRF